MIGVLALEPGRGAHHQSVGRQHHRLLCGGNPLDEIVEQPGEGRALLGRLGHSVSSSGLVTSFCSGVAAPSSIALSASAKLTIAGKLTVAASAKDVPPGAAPLPFSAGFGWSSEDRCFGISSRDASRRPRVVPCCSALMM